MSRLTDPDVASLRSAIAGMVGGRHVVDPSSVARYDNDITGDHRGRAALIVRPGTTEEVAAIVHLCNERRIAIVPQGGHTGLVAGGTPSADATEVVISLERLNRVRSLDLTDGVAVVEAGVVLSEFKKQVEGAGGYFPLSIGSQESCQIGGNIATNAGGINVVRYGMTRALVLGLEVVLPDGRVFRDLRGLHKNNTGYDMKQMFIGAEGTLGIITAAAVRLVPKPAYVETMFLGLNAVEDVVALFARMRADCGDMISAFELMMKASIERVCRTEQGVRNPFAGLYPAYAIVEISTTGGPPVREWIETYLATLMESGLILDAALAETVEQARNIWALRERIVESQARQGPYLRTDISTAISAVPTVIAEGIPMVEALVPGAQAHPYGHVGDGNLHFNVIRPDQMDPQDFAPLIKKIEAELFRLVDRLNGSISAEHGIGIAKRSAFAERSDAVSDDLMRKLKQTLDPNGIMCPGRIFE